MSRNVDDTTSLSRLFHLNSEPWLNERANPNAPFLQKTKSYPDADRVDLPETCTGEMARLAASRRSERSFTDVPMSLADVAAVLRSGYQALSPDRSDGGQKMLRRPVPSAGGLYPLEIYLLVRNVTGLSKGVYHYDAVGDGLETLSDGLWEQQAGAAFPTWSFVKNAPVIFCIGADFARNQSKYGPRGYRYILFEAGHVVQNKCLAAAELQLATLCMGGFNDRVLNGLIGLDGVKEAVVYTVALGQSG